MRGVPLFVVGHGPSELHAHINLEEKATAALPPGQRPTLVVLDASHHDGHWSVVARLCQADEAH